jgi:hypothetical protein
MVWDEDGDMTTVGAGPKLRNLLVTRSHGHERSLKLATDACALPPTTARMAQ